MEVYRCLQVHIDYFDGNIGFLKIVLGSPDCWQIQLVLMVLIGANAALSSNGVLIKRTRIRLLAQDVTIALFLTLSIREPKYKLAVPSPVNLYWIQHCCLLDFVFTKKKTRSQNTISDQGFSVPYLLMSLSCFLLIRGSSDLDFLMILVLCIKCSDWCH